MTFFTSLLNEKKNNNQRLGTITNNRQTNTDVFIRMHHTQCVWIQKETYASLSKTIARLSPKVHNDCLISSCRNCQTLRKMIHHNRHSRSLLFIWANDRLVEILGYKTILICYNVYLRLATTLKWRPIQMTRVRLDANISCKRF